MILGIATVKNCRHADRVEELEALVMVYDATLAVITAYDDLWPDHVRLQIDAARAGHLEVMGIPSMKIEPREAHHA